MTDILLLSGILTGAVRVLVGLILIYRLLSTKRPDGRSLGLGLAGATILTVLLSLLHAPDFYRMALEAVLIAACVHWMQGAELRMGLFVGTFYEIGFSPSGRFSCQHGWVCCSAPRISSIPERWLDSPPSGCSMDCWQVWRSGSPENER